MQIPRVDDRHYVSEQYRDASNLTTRLDLHARFSSDKRGWHPWAFDHLTSLPAECSLLELGCGAGALWQQNLDRIPPGWETTLTDLSAGMVSSAQQNLRGQQFSYQTADAQCIPFEAGSFDAIIANHMLYHVPNRPAAFAEIQRVLRPGGWFFASTNSARHMQELVALLKKFMPLWKTWGGASRSFQVENGEAQLAPWFEDIHFHPYENALLVTEAAPLVDYVLSGRLGRFGWLRSSFEKFVSREIAAQDGVLRITESGGLFVCQRRT